MIITRKIGGYDDKVVTVLEDGEKLIFLKYKASVPVD